MATTTVSVVGIPFIKRGIDGDFGYMIKQRQYDDALFIIMENFLDSIRDDTANGGGTACIRKLCIQHVTDADIAKGKKVRAVGIPTGWSIESEGFTHMDTLRYGIKRAIDLSMERLIIVLSMFSFKRIIYSCDSDNPTLIGTGIFKESIGSDVIQYISHRLHSLNVAIPNTKVTLDVIRTEEQKLLPYALAIYQNRRLANENARLISILTKNGINHKSPSPNKTIGKKHAIIQSRLRSGSL